MAPHSCPLTVAGDSIHHVGSTAVPGLDAKPVIDILAGIGDLAAGRSRIGLLARLTTCTPPTAPVKCSGSASRTLLGVPTTCTWSRRLPPLP